MSNFGVHKRTHIVGHRESLHQTLHYDVFTTGSRSNVTDWLKLYYGKTYDAVYVPPGVNLAEHIIQQLAIDYEDKGR